MKHLKDIITTVKGGEASAKNEAFFFIKNPTFVSRVIKTMNNPLKYTDPSGYSYKPAYWNVGTNGAYYVNQYANSGPTGLIGPGSGNGI